MIPEWAPNIHPLVVHFPIALLIAAVAFHVASILTKKDWLEKATTALYVAGSLSAVAAFLTGRSGVDEIAIPPELSAFVTSHSDAGRLTAILFAVVAISRLALRGLSLSEKTKRIANIVLVVAAIAATMQLKSASEKGAELVFRHGIGVSPEQSTEAVFDTLSSGESLRTTASGDWIFQPQTLSDLNVAGIDFQKGSSGDLREVNSLDSSLTFWIQEGDVLFVIGAEGDKTLASVQLDRTAFDGTVRLIHHFSSPSTYDYLEIAESNLLLGRFSASAVREMGSGPWGGDNLTSFQVVGDGTHFRGYADGDLVVHGHGPAAAPGRVGLQVTGTGVLTIKEMSMTEISD